MKRAQGFSCFFAPPVLLQAVPAGKEPYQHHLPIKRRHTSPSSACWKSPNANMGTGNDWGQPGCSGFLLDTFPLSSRHPLQQMSHTPHGQQGRVGFFPRERTEPQKEDGSCLPKETEFLHRQLSEGRICLMHEADARQSLQKRAGKERWAQNPA